MCGGSYRRSVGLQSDFMCRNSSLCTHATRFRLGFIIPRNELAFCYCYAFSVRRRRRSLKDAFSWNGENTVDNWSRGPRDRGKIAVASQKIMLLLIGVLPELSDGLSPRGLVAGVRDDVPRRAPWRTCAQADAQPWWRSVPIPVWVRRDEVLLAQGKERSQREPGGDPDRPSHVRHIVSADRLMPGTTASPPVPPQYPSASSGYRRVAVDTRIVDP